MPTTDPSPHAAIADEIIVAAGGCTCGSHQAAVIRVLEQLAPNRLGHLLMQRSMALNRVAEQNDRLRRAIRAVIETARVGRGNIDPTAVHDALGHDVVWDVLFPSGGPLLRFAVGENYFGHELSHDIGLRPEATGPEPAMHPDIEVDHG